MIAVDTQILVYAHRTESEFHMAATMALNTLIKAGGRWAIPWPCLHEFIAVVTNPKAFSNPTPPNVAIGTIKKYLQAEGMTTISEGPQHLWFLSEVLRSSGAVGGVVHDARVAAICMENGVSEIWTNDRDFRKFTGIRTSNPVRS